MCDMTHSYVWHESFICATWLIRVRDMTYFINVTWLIHVYDMTHTPSACIHASTLSQSSVPVYSTRLTNSNTHCNTLRHTATHWNTLQHTATHCNTLQHTAAHCNTLHNTAAHCNTLQHSTLQHTATRSQSSVPVYSWLIHTCDRTHSYVWNDRFIYVTWLNNMCDVIHSYTWWHSQSSVSVCFRSLK